MAGCKTNSFPMLSMIVLVSSMAACNRVAAAGRQFQEETPDIPNFGFPELNPPAPRFEFRPPVTTDLSAELKTESRNTPDNDIPLDFGSSRSNLPAPRFRFPFRPPVTDLSPELRAESKHTPENEISPNSGFPELNPAAPKLPFSKPVMRDLIARLELLVKLEKESRPKATAPVDQRTYEMSPNRGPVPYTNY